MIKSLEIIKISYRNIFRSKRRSLFSLLAVLISVMFIVGMNSMFDGQFEEKSKKMQMLLLGNLEVNSREYVKENDDYSIQYPLESKDSTIDQLIKRVESLNGVKGAFPRISTGVRLDSLHKKHGVLWGINIEKEFQFHDFGKQVEGRLPKGPKEILLGRGLLKKLRLNIGDKLVFKFKSYNGFEKYYKAKIVGSYDFEDERFNSNYMLIPYEILHALSGFTDNQTQKIHIFTTNRALGKVKHRLSQDFSSFDVKSWMEDPFVFAFESFKVWRFNISLSFVIVAAFLLVLTILMVIKERIREIGIISAMGMTRKEIVSMFFFEGAIISFIGGAIGTILMFIWLLIFKDNPLTFKSINPQTGLEVINTMNFKFSIKGLLWGFLFVSVTSSLISIIPSLKAATIKPIDAIRGE